MIKNENNDKNKNNEIFSCRGFKKYSKSTLAHERSIDRNEAEMKKLFWQRLRLKVSHFTNGGTTNTGNLVKEAFSKPEILAEIMHVPLDLILDLQTIFEVLDGGFIVDAEQFRKFTKNWLTKFHGSSYSWNWLCPTMHFVMHHGWEVRKKIKNWEKLLNC